MDQEPLVGEEIEAGTRFLAEFQKQYPVQSAFWLREPEDGRWSLYVASERITDDNFYEAYGEVVRIAHANRDPWFNTMWVKVIGADDTLAKAVAELQRRYPIRVPTHLPGRLLDGMDTEEIYLYPTPLAAPVG
jgi:hypothetical protein